MAKLCFHTFICFGCIHSYHSKNEKKYGKYAKYKNWMDWNSRYQFSQIISSDYLTPFSFLFSIVLDEIDNAFLFERKTQTVHHFFAFLCHSQQFKPSSMLPVFVFELLVDFMFLKFNLLIEQMFFVFFQLWLLSNGTKFSPSLICVGFVEFHTNFHFHPR